MFCIDQQQKNRLKILFTFTGNLKIYHIKIIVLISKEKTLVQDILVQGTQQVTDFHSLFQYY